MPACGVMRTETPGATISGLQVESKPGLLPRRLNYLAGVYFDSVVSDLGPGRKRVRRQGPVAITLVVEIIVGLLVVGPREVRSRRHRVFRQAHIESLVERLAGGHLRGHRFVRRASPRLIRGTLRATPLKRQSGGAGIVEVHSHGEFLPRHGVCERFRGSVTAEEIAARRFAFGRDGSFERDAKRLENGALKLGLLGGKLVQHVIFRLVAEAARGNLRGESVGLLESCGQRWRNFFRMLDGKIAHSAAQPGH